MTGNMNKGEKFSFNRLVLLSIKIVNMKLVLDSSLSLSFDEEGEWGSAFHSDAHGRNIINY